jgi:hypothetical protein
LLEVHELLTLLPHHACGDVVGAKSIAELSPRHLIIRETCGSVVGPPRAGITPQLLHGEEGLLHLSAAQEPELGVHHLKPVVGLKRLSYLDEERRVRRLELERFLPPLPPRMELATSCHSNSVCSSWDSRIEVIA